MKKSIVDYLEENTKKNPQGIIFEEPERNITYEDFNFKSKMIATRLIKDGHYKKKVAIFLDKNIDCLASMVGSLYCNSVYTVLDIKSPINRLRTIMDTLYPDVVITSNTLISEIDTVYSQKCNIICVEDILEEIDYENINKIKKTMIDTDPAYILFTSGSTGIPKGTVVSHKSVIRYIETIIDTFDIDEKTNFGSQTPFYFSMSILDVFATIIAGSKLTIIPKMLFSFPYKLIEYLNEKKVNTIYWVPTAMSIVANRDTFSEITPLFLRKILFAGEVMPTKQLNYWINHCPNNLFANLYGPTEITDTGTYYIVNRSFEDEESLPIGVPFENCDILLLNENDELAQDGEEGEICFRGSFLGEGYYNNWEKTRQCFCQNPVNKYYPEIIYRTGDIGKKNEYGEYLYISRKDFQVKRAGYRIELGEIESNISAIDNIKNCVCVYDDKEKTIILYYVGNITEEEIVNQANERLVKYMRPDYYFKLKNIPINPNGKYDRIRLLKEYRGDKNE